MPEHPDDFEVALRAWSAHDKIIREAYAVTEILDLDPALVDQMQSACRGDDTAAMREVVCQLVEAVNEELASRSS